MTPRQHDVLRKYGLQRFRIGGVEHHRHDRQRHFVGHRLTLIVGRRESRNEGPEQRKPRQGGGFTSRQKPRRENNLVRSVARLGVLTWPVSYVRTPGRCSGAPIPVLPTRRPSARNSTLVFHSFTAPETT